MADSDRAKIVFPTVIAILAIGAIMILGIMVLQPGKDNTVLIGGIMALQTLMIPTILAYLKSEESYQKSEETRLMVNGHLLKANSDKEEDTRKFMALRDEQEKIKLLAERAAALAEGRSIGIAEQKATEADAARTAAAVNAAVLASKAEIPTTATIPVVAAPPVVIEEKKTP